jgi:hypothetical protein
MMRKTRGAAVLVAALGSCAFAGTAQAATITCSVTAVAHTANISDLLVAGRGLASCDQPVTHQLDVAISTQTPDLPVSVTASVILGAGSRTCTGCTDVRARAVTPLVPGIRYDVTAVDWIVGPPGSTIADTDSCTPLFPRNVALCIDGTMFQA